MIKPLIKKTPVIGKFVVNFYSRMKGVPYFTTSKKYWEDRYKNGGNSGAGSYHNFAEFKAEVINNFVTDNNIKNVIEFGCGDGNQLKYFQFNNYTGFDVSSTAISFCNETFISDNTKQFKLATDYSNESAELTLSLDVIYHLIEDTAYRNYMRNLFNASSKYVIVYSSNTDKNTGVGVHVKHRKFTKWIEANAPGFTLMNHIPNKYPWNGNEIETSFADFYVFERNS